MKTDWTELFYNIVMLVFGIPAAILFVWMMLSAIGRVIGFS